MTDYDFKALESLLAKVRKFATPAKESSLFAVGGRGYYENPASDLLAFFLKPDAEHRLGNLFLSTFLGCMGVNYSQLELEHVVITREERTEKGNFIDLQILGSNWCLLIENKINHWEANPFADYEAHAKKLDGNTKLYSVLSPSGRIKNEGKTEDWKGVSYSDYCKALRQKMPGIDSYEPRSKWQIFAREFILHMENELYNPPMTPEQASFVETHAAGLLQAQKLLQLYSSHLCSVVKKEVQERIGYEVEVTANWAILIKAPARWGNAYIALRPPTEDDSKRIFKFEITIYPEADELKRGQANEFQKGLLEGMAHAKYYWLTKVGFKDCSEAINFLVPRIKLIERPLNP